MGKMNAKEIVEKYSSQCLSLSEEMEVAIIKYAKDKCKEQREICDECFKKGLMKMEQAPEPKIK